MENNHFTTQLNNVWNLENYILKSPMIELLESDNARENFINYLIQMYHYVKFSCPLMELTCSKLDKSKDVALIEYLTMHIEEEKGHEKWVLNDLKLLGLNPDEIKKSLPSRETISMIGSQFYMINEINPIAFFGYIYTLESHPPTIEFIETLSKTLDIPLNAMSTLIHHADLDPLHSIELNEIINSYITNQDEKYLVEYNMKMTIKNISQLLYSIL